MWVSSVTFEMPLRQMHCDGLGISSQKQAASQQGERTAMEKKGTD